MGLLEDMKSKIISTTSETTSTIYIGDLPDNVNAVVLYPTGGFNPEYVLGQQLPSITNPTFQVIIKDSSFNTAYTRMTAIKNALSGLSNQTINTNKYLTIFVLGDILALGKDSKGKTMLSLNFTCKVA